MSDIEDFLKRAAQRRRQQRQQPVVEILEPEPEVIEAEPVDAADVVDHVREHLDMSAYADRASHLGKKVGQADDKLEAHVHEVFDHSLGRLARSAPVSAEPSQETPDVKPEIQTDLLAMLRDPQTLRQAIIVSEVFRRPDDA